MKKMPSMGAAIIALTKPKPEGPGMDLGVGGEEGDDLEVVADEMIEAFIRKDKVALAAALRDAHMVLCAEMEDDEEMDAEEEYGPEAGENAPAAGEGRRLRGE